MHETRLTTEPTFLRIPSRVSVCRQRWHSGPPVVILEHTGVLPGLDIEGDDD